MLWSAHVVSMTVATCSNNDIVLYSWWLVVVSRNLDDTAYDWTPQIYNFCSRCEKIIQTYLQSLSYPSPWNATIAKERLVFQPLFFDGAFSLCLFGWIFFHLQPTNPPLASVKIVLSWLKPSMQWWCPVVHKSIPKDGGWIPMVALPKNLQKTQPLHFGGIKQCKSMVNLRFHPFCWCFCWVGNIMTPVQLTAIFAPGSQIVGDWWVAFQQTTKPCPVLKNWCFCKWAGTKKERHHLLTGLIFKREHVMFFFF